MAARTRLVRVAWSALFIGAVCIGFAAWMAMTQIVHDEVVFRFVALFPSGLDHTERGKRGIDTPATVWIDGKAVGHAPYEIGIDELLRIGTPVAPTESWPMADHGGHSAADHRVRGGWSYDCWWERRNGTPDGTLHQLEWREGGHVRRVAFRVKLTAADGGSLTELSGVPHEPWFERWLDRVLVQCGYSRN